MLARERGWTDVTLTLGHGFYCRLQRYSEFDTLTLSGPGQGLTLVHFFAQPEPFLSLKPAKHPTTWDKKCPR